MLQLRNEAAGGPNCLRAWRTGVTLAIPGFPFRQHKSTQALRRIALLWGRRMKHYPLGVAIRQLRPTQMTIGFREVERKRSEWHKASSKKRVALLHLHTIPAVIGPKGRYYITDHHHFVRALELAEAEEIAVYVLADLSRLPKQEFWTFLDNSDWCHAYDAAGKRCALSAIPKAFAKLTDDPYRSIAGELIRQGACAKNGHPFSEFLWADFVRHRIDGSLVEDDFDAALAKAIKLAGSGEAQNLPGWCGSGKDNSG